MMDANILFEIKNLYKTFGDGTRALVDINLNIKNELQCLLVQVDLVNQLYLEC